LLVTSPRPEVDALKDYYQSDNYISHTGKANNLINYLYLQIRKITLAQKRELLNSLTTDRSILDYGCGTGALIEYLQNYNWNVAGYEPNNSENLTHKNVLIFKDKTEIKGRYNLITMWHVLEHVPEPAQTLEEIKPFIKENGKLIIAVPNPKSYDALHYKEQWAAYDVPRHLYHFNKNSLEQLLHNKGYTIEKILPMKFDAYYVSLLSEQYKGAGLLKFIKAFYRGFKSNFKASKTGEYSSLIYIAKP
jgi:SAM-dependent methyltransferase